MKVTLTRFTPDPVMAIEEAASQCYQSKPNPSGKIMKACYLSGHHSVLEHVSFTWHIEGVSRALLAQLTRHRIGTAFSVKSQRYCSESQFEFVTPPSIIMGSPTSKELYIAAMESAQSYYDALIFAGFPAEDARMVLPNACCTTLQCAMNLRELIHFCNERLCSRAQWEIRAMCWKMVEAVNEATDNSFDYMLQPKCWSDPEHPFCPEGSKSCGKCPTLEKLYALAATRSQEQ